MRLMIFTTTVFMFPVLISLLIIEIRAKQIKNKKAGVKFNDESQMVCSKQLQNAKNQKNITNRTVSTFSRSKGFDVNQDEPLSKAEKNVLSEK